MSQNSSAIAEPDESMINLQQRATNVPLKALNIGCRKKLCLYMDPEAGFLMDKSICNDWCGLAELVGFTSLEIENLKRKASPTMELLYLWGISMTPVPTVYNLIQHLLYLERVDVVTECSDVIERDIERYEEHRRSMREIRERNERQYARPPEVSEQAPVTIQEVESGQKEYYDAFVIYNPDAVDQMNFVKEMADTLEGSEYGLRLFIPWRDDLPGDAMYSVTAEIIEKKCRRSIVVLSHSFNRSPAADFQLKFVQSLSPGARSKRVIPVQIERCPVPNILNFVSPAPFYNLGMRNWQWPRVVATIKSELNPSLEKWASPSIDPNEICLDTSNRVHRQFWATTIALMPLDNGNESEETHTGRSNANLRGITHGIEHDETS